MTALNVGELVRMSRPVLRRFAEVEPRPWDRGAVLVELVGELGSLAHQVQRWEGFKSPRPSLAALADECSDVLFLVIRLAEADGATLPDELPLPQDGPATPSAEVLAIAEDLGRLISISPDGAEVHCRVLQRLARLAAGFDFTLAEAHAREMAIATQFFAAARGSWPRPNPWRRPLETFRLWRLLREKKQWRRSKREPTGGER